MVEAWTYEAAKENTPEITQAEYEEQRAHALSEEVLDKQKRFYIDYPDKVSIQSIDFRPSYEFDQNDRLTGIELTHSDIKTNVSSCRKLVVKVRSLVEAKYGRPDTGTRGVFTFKDYSSIAVEHLAMKNVCIVTVKYRAPGGKGSF